MAKKDTADILALEDTGKNKKDTYDVSGLSGLVKSKFIDAENARQFDEQRWLRSYRNCQKLLVLAYLPAIFFFGEGERGVPMGRHEGWGRRWLVLCFPG